MIVRTVNLIMTYLGKVFAKIHFKLRDAWQPIYGEE